MNTHNKESVQQRLQMSYGHTEPYIVPPYETNSFNTGKTIKNVLTFSLAITLI